MASGLPKAAEAGDAQLVARLLGEGCDVNEADEDGWTALYVASLNGHHKVVRLLLEHQDVEVNKANGPFGYTALLIASRKGLVKVVRKLLAHQKIEVNKPMAGPQTALMIASQFGRVGVVRLLLAHKEIEVNKTEQNGATALYVASQNGHVEVVRLLLARQDVDVNMTLADGATAMMRASDNGQHEVVRLLLAHQEIEVNKSTQNGWTALIMASHQGHFEVVQLLLAHPDVETNGTLTDGRSALCLASLSGHGAIVRLLVSYRAHEQVRLMVADAIDSLPADLLTVLPGYAAQAAALRLPLDVAAALGDTEEERAAADVLASQSAVLDAANAQLAAAAAQTPEELTRASEALARAPSDDAAYAAQERKADAALRAATTITTFRLAQARQLIVRNILFSRFDALVRGAGVSDEFARLFSGQRLEEFKLTQAESAARFALLHNGQEPADRLLGATRALSAVITALVAERAERDKLECAGSELFADASAMSISPRLDTFCLLC
jgi:ankyrin repeat protein